MFSISTIAKQFAFGDSRLRLTNTLFFGSAHQKLRRDRRRFQPGNDGCDLESRQMLSTVQYTVTDTSNSATDTGSLPHQLNAADAASALAGPNSTTQFDVVFSSAVKGNIQPLTSLSEGHNVGIFGPTSSNGLETGLVVIDGSHLPSGVPLLTTTTPTVLMDVQSIPLENCASTIFTVQPGQEASFINDTFEYDTNALLMQSTGVLVSQADTFTADSGYTIDDSGGAFLDLFEAQYLKNTAAVEISVTGANESGSISANTFSGETGNGTALVMQLGAGSQFVLFENYFTGDSATGAAAIGSGTLFSTDNTWSGNTGIGLYDSGVTINSTGDTFSGNSGPAVLEAFAANVNLVQSSFINNTAVAIEAQTSGTVNVSNSQFNNAGSTELSGAVNTMFSTDTLANSPVIINGTGEYTFNAVTFNGESAPFINASLLGLSAQTSALSLTGCTLENLNYNPTTKTIINPTGGSPAIVFGGIDNIALAMSGCTVVNCYNESTANSAWTGWTIVAAGGVNFSGDTINTVGGVDVILGFEQSAFVSTTNITDTTSPMALEMLGDVAPDTSSVRMVSCEVVGATGFFGDIADVHLTSCTFVGTLTFATNGTHEQD